jgi:transcriptional regulator with XRE-family HTH domain
MQDAPETGLMIDALKQLLREQGVTYRELARRVRVSEPTVKRWLSTRRLALDRLEKLCRALGVSLFALGRRAKTAARAEVYTLNAAQERRLVRDAGLFYFFWMLVGGHSLGAIRRRFRLDEARLRSYLTTLHTLGIIELRGGERFVLKVPGDVRWNPDGPIDRLLVARSVPAFLRGRFRGEGEYFRFVVGALTPESAAAFRAQLAALVERVFQQSVGSDALRPGARRTGTLVAFGPMDFSLREVLARGDDEADAAPR